MLWINLLMVSILLALSVAMHEIGHWLWFWRNKRQNFNLQWYYDSLFNCGFKSVWPGKLTAEEEMNSLLFGIGAGIFIIMFVMLSSQTPYMMFALPIYMAGCKHDLLRLIEIIKEKNIDFGR